MNEHQDWQKTVTAAKTLGMLPSTLLSRVRRGMFKEGVHYRKIQYGLRNHYQFYIPEVKNYKKPLADSQIVINPSKKTGTVRTEDKSALQQRWENRRKSFTPLNPHRY